MLDLIFIWLGTTITDMITQNQAVLGYVITGAVVACTATASAVILYIIDMLCGAFKQLWKRG